MRPRDWFLVGIRLLGVYVVYRGVVEAANLLSVLFGAMPQYYLERDFGGSSWAATKNYLLYAIVDFALGLYFVYGGEEITKRVFDEYPRDEEEEKPDAVS
jgi:hypothetical protein